MANHTPGPWFSDHRPDFQKDRPFIYAAHDAGLPDRSNQGASLVIARIGSGGTIADARLIAAAPDLLAALEYLADVVSSSALPDVWADYARSMESARAAIRKAKGE